MLLLAAAKAGGLKPAATTALQILTLTVLKTRHYFYL
jgi:hypothetical protein